MKNNVKQSDWYIGKYGTQSEVMVSTTASLVPGFSLNKSEVDGTQSATSSFFKDKLEAKGITFSTPAAAPTFTKKVYEPGTASKGFTQSFAEVVKMKLEEAATPVVAPTASNPLPFEQKFINRGLGNATASTPFASKARKFFAAVPTNVTKLDATDFQSFVAEVGKFTRNTAASVIKLKKVTVNDLIVTDLNYTFKSEDVVRVGLIGHFVNNPEGIAIVK